MTSAHLPPKRAGAQVKVLAKDFTEVIWAGEPGGIGDLGDPLLGVQQPLGGFIQAHLLNECRRREAGGCAEKMAEIAAAHTAPARQFVDANRAAKRREHELPHLGQQPLAVGLGSAVVAQPLVFPQKPKQHLLVRHLVVRALLLVAGMQRHYPQHQRVRRFQGGHCAVLADTRCDALHDIRVGND